jgi:hypothetical protein
MKTFSLFSLLALTACSYALQSPSIGTCKIFPSDNAWNWDISGYEVHPNSDNFIQAVGPTTGLHPDFGTPDEYGIPYVVVNADQPKIGVTFTAYGDESDPGPYPIPLNAPIEGTEFADSTADRHVLCVDTSGKILYELFNSFPQATFWEAGCGAVFNLTSNAQRQDGWTSADAAGLPIFPGLVRYEEVVIKKEIPHAIRVTFSSTYAKYIYPATHLTNTSSDPNRPYMGLRFRLKAGFDISGYTEDCQVILRAMKKYGLIVADNGSNWYFSGAPDERWNDDNLNLLKQVKGSEFEVVLTVDENGEPIFPQNSTIKHQSAMMPATPPLRKVMQIKKLESRQITVRYVFDIHGKKIATPAAG